MPSRALRACVRCRRWVGPSRSRRHVCLTSAPAFCVCRCVRACLRARAQFRRGRRRHRKHRERQVSPPPFAAKRVDLLFCAWVIAVLRTECVRALPSVDQSATQSPPRVFDEGAGVCVCLGMRACLRLRAQSSHGRRRLEQHREQQVRPRHRSFCFAPG
jgi:hypothetical protein